MKKRGIYVHIPFCQSKCYYCDFVSFSKCSKDNVGLYFESLWSEIEQAAEKTSIKSVYFGGGTPSFVPEIYIIKTLDFIKEKFNLCEDAEITIEANPDSLTQEKANAYFKAGFNRVSIGLQAAQDAVLKTLGRPHTFADFMRAISVLRKAGFKNLSADLMFGLPNQSIEDVLESVERLAEIKEIKHVSCYSLELKEGTVLKQKIQSGELTLPTENQERKMAYALREALNQAGLNQYEISNFARPGFESRHNGAYWDLSPYYGFGLGAAAYINNERKTNTPILKVYTDWGIASLAKAAEERTPPPTIERHHLKIKEQQEDFMFLGLRRMKGVDDCQFREQFGQSFFILYQEIIESLKSQGLIWQKETRIGLTLKGQDFANRVFMAFLQTD